MQIQTFTRDELERSLRQKVLALPEVTLRSGVRCGTGGRHPPPHAGRPPGVGEGPGRAGPPVPAGGSARGPPLLDPGHQLRPHVRSGQPAGRGPDRPLVQHAAVQRLHQGPGGLDPRRPGDQHGGPAGDAVPPRRHRQGHPAAGLQSRTSNLSTVPDASRGSAVTGAGNQVRADNGAKAKIY